MKNTSKKLKSILLVSIAAVAVIAVVFLRHSDRTPVIPSKTNGFEEQSLENGLVFTGIADAAGQFPEDGSDEFIPHVLSATFRNDSKQTLQYGRAVVTIDGEDYTFEYSTLPPKATVRAFEINRKACPQKVQQVSVHSEHAAYFPEEPTLDETRLELEALDGAIRIKNNSDEPISKELSVYYKNTLGDIYMGGITYRVRVAHLEPGEELNVYASHASANGTQVMFVTYGN